MAAAESIQKPRCMAQAARWVWHYHWARRTESHIYILPFGGDTNSKYSTPGCYSTPCTKLKWQLMAVKSYRSWHTVWALWVFKKNFKNHTVSSKLLCQFFHRRDYCFQWCDKHVQELSVISGTIPAVLVECQVNTDGKWQKWRQNANDSWLSGS